MAKKMTTTLTKNHRGRPPIHPPDDKKRLMTRTTETEYHIWAAAAKKEGLTIGPWSRMILNRAARELGFELPVD
jgi:hypothetical protein